MAASQFSFDWKAVALAIDHTQLRADARPEQILTLCREAGKYGFFSVCVQPCHVALASNALQGTSVKIATVVGFPQGATLTSVKRYETDQTILLGAHEVDMVLNVGMLKAGNREFVENDIRAVAQAAHSRGALLKVIIEACLLTRDEKILACELAVSAGADYVKTSTGMSTSGATVEDVVLMRSVVGDRAGVKAAGGIRTAEEAIAMLKAGASRIGASASVAIVRALGAPE